MSENRKLLNAVISFVVVGIFFFGIMYLFEYWEEIVGNGSNSRTTYLNPIGGVAALIFSVLVIGVVVYFIFKYLIADTFKYRIVSRIRNKLKIRERQLEHQRLLEYTEQLEVLYGELSSFRHDYLNILTSLESGIRDKNIEMIEDVYHQVISPTRKLVESNEYVLGQLRNLGIPAIKSILSAKVIGAQAKGIEVKVELEEPIHHIPMHLVDFSRVFSILLDNAIEAAWEVQERYVSIVFIKVDGLLHVVIENSCLKSGIDTEKIFEKGVTSKGGTRGTGLYTVKRILRDYPYTMLETHYEGSRFRQTLTLKEGKK